MSAQSQPKPTLYISGPMSGLPHENFPAFHGAASILRKLGYPVVNPADLSAPGRHTWGENLRRDIRLLTECDVLILLHGWEKSRGANAEFTVARLIDIPTFTFVEFLWSKEKLDQISQIWDDVWK